MKTLLALLFFALPTVIQAVELSRVQEGRLAVAQCYSECSARSYESFMRYNDRVTSIVDYLLSYGFRFLSRSDQLDAIDVAQLQICTSAGGHIKFMDMCRAGCVDTEQVYGVSSSFVRSRFNRLFIRTQNQMREWGFWDTWNREVDIESACNSFFSTSRASTNDNQIGEHSVFGGGGPLPEPFVPLRLPEWEY